MVNKDLIQTAEYKYIADEPGDNPSSYSKEYINVICSDNTNVQHHVPLDNQNTDYNTDMEWVADGNTITDNDPN